MTRSPSCGPGFELGPTLLDEHAAYVARWGTRLGGIALPRLYFDRLTIPHLQVLFDHIDAEVAGADLVVSHPFPHLIAGPAAERRRVRSAVLDLFPMLVPSASNPLPGQPDLGATVNRAIWRAARSPLVSRRASFGAFRRFRAGIGLDTTGWSFFDAPTSRRLTIGLWSKHYWPTRDDWPTSYRLAGFSSWLDQPGAPQPADVDAFLNRGDAPVLVTLGSNAAAAHPHLFAEAAQAIERLGHRALLLTSTDTIAERVRTAVNDAHGVWAFVPLGGLLGRVRAVVHAGGLGTLGPVLHAGLPSVVRPAVTDQIWHGKRLEALGIGILARHTLGHAIEHALADDRLADNARAFAEQLGPNDGATTAAHLIEGALDERRAA